MYSKCEHPRQGHESMGGSRNTGGGKGASREGARDMWAWEGEGAVLMRETREGGQVEKGHPGKGAPACEGGGAGQGHQCRKGAGRARERERGRGTRQARERECQTGTCICRSHLPGPN